MKAALYVAGAMALAATSGIAEAATTISSQTLTYQAVNSPSCQVGPAQINGTAGTTVQLSSTSIFSSTGTPLGYSDNSVSIPVSCTVTGLSVSLGSTNSGLTLDGKIYKASPTSSTETSSKVDYAASAMLRDNGGNSAQSTYSSASGVANSSTADFAPGSSGRIDITLTTQASGTPLPSGTYSDVITVTVTNTQ